MHAFMDGTSGDRTYGDRTYGTHTHIPHRTPTWLKSHVHYESFRTHAPRDVPKINTHAVGWTSTHPPTASVIIRCSFFAANPRDVPICRSADLPIARTRTDAWVVVVTRSRLWVSRTTTETTRTTTETTCIRRRRAWNHTRGDGRGVSRRVDDVYDDDGDGTVAPIVVIRRPPSVRRRRRRTHTRAHAHSAHACLNTRRTRAS